MKHGRFIPGRRARRAAAAGATLFALLVMVLVDAQLRAAHRRDPDRPPSATVAQVTGLADLALNSSARWLRHPSQAEPGAPFSDVPGGLDVDPAGALLGPPHEVVVSGESSSLPVRRRHR